MGEIDRDGGFTHSSFLTGNGNADHTRLGNCCATVASACHIGSLFFRMRVLRDSVVLFHISSFFHEIPDFPQAPQRSPRFSVAWCWEPGAAGKGQSSPATGRAASPPSSPRGTLVKQPRPAARRGLPEPGQVADPLAAVDPGDRWSAPRPPTAWCSPWSRCRSNRVSKACWPPRRRSRSGRRHQRQLRAGARRRRRRARNRPSHCRSLRGNQARPAAAAVHLDDARRESGRLDPGRLGRRHQRGGAVQPIPPDGLPHVAGRLRLRREKQRHGQRQPPRPHRRAQKRQGDERATGEDVLRSLRQLTSFYDPYSRSFDEAGGLFPAGAIDLLSTAAIHPGLPAETRARCLETARELLVDLLPSAMFDPLEGGVFSSRRGNSWALPAFYRDCVSQARAAVALINAYRATGDKRALEKALGLISFAEKSYRHLRGRVLRRHGRGNRPRRLALERRGNRKGTPAGRRRLVDQGHRHEGTGESALGSGPAPRVFPLQQPGNRQVRRGNRRRTTANRSRPSPRGLR